MFGARNIKLQTVVDKLVLITISLWSETNIVHGSWMNFNKLVKAELNLS